MVLNLPYKTLHESKVSILFDSHFRYAYYDYIVHSSTYKPACSKQSSNFNIQLCNGIKETYSCGLLL